MSQRFSDAELAAEYWRAESDNDWVSMMGRCADGNWDGSKVEHVNRKLVLHRFATLPHAHDPEPKTVYVYDATGRCIGNFPKPDTWTE